MKISSLFHFIVFCFLVIIPTLFAAETEKNTNETLIDTKCSKCHTLNRVFAFTRTKEEWSEIVKKMVDKNPEWISQKEAVQIVNEIQTLFPERVNALLKERKHYEDVRLLFVDRCTFCHSANRILLKEKTPKEWSETVERMRADNKDLITKEEAEKITRFLIKRAVMMKEDAGGDIFVKKCIICHPGDRILLETHDKTGWEKIVIRMRNLARDSNPTVRLSYDEAKMVVDLILKTQGIETKGTEKK